LDKDYIKSLVKAAKF